MKRRLGRILEEWRGDRPRTHLARFLGMSYTFVKSMEGGTRFPSDRELLRIARKLRLDPDELLIAAYSDRSPALAAALERTRPRRKKARA